MWHTCRKEKGQKALPRESTFLVAAMNSPQYHYHVTQCDGAHIVVWCLSLTIAKVHYSRQAFILIVLVPGKHQVMINHAIVKVKRVLEKCSLSSTAFYQTFHQLNCRV